ncbi:hypothetical protein Golomagni_07764 [Golovinomyces magnicellulatus]|nr:hypothetical protein Golomagni_07764 [Golovinomyces magnicellulatus]
MVDDGLYTKHKVPVPDYLLGQHVVAMKTGTLGSRSGTLMAGADSLKITIHGQGGHGSQPHTTIDPVVMASHIVVRLQSIVSREINPSDISVLTVGCLKAGQIENVIADHAEIGVDTRSMRPETREKLLASIRRVVDAECQASNATAPPEYKISRHFPVTSNDASMTETLVGSFKSHFGESYQEMQAVTMSEDFSILATSQNRPSVFWAFGGIEAGFWDQKVAEGKVNEVPSNHTSKFAPVLDPTLRTGVEAFTVGALTFFNKK